MIPAQQTMDQIDSLPGEEVEFTIGDPRWVMRTQADLYSNRELAVIREYSTNAADANKQKALDEGTDIPAIEVTLPSLMNPNFTVRDRGYGMTREVLTEVYTKFGSSTKRDTNHFNGMLGYGSKSAVAYTTQFTVISVAEGLKTIAVITRKPDWSIVMKIVSQTRSDDPSGTTVQVPVHNWQEFTQKANDFYKFWRSGTVLVNGVEPKPYVGDKIAENFFASAEWNNSYVVMGNVPYRIENPEALFWNTGIRSMSFVAYIDNGDVEFTPSREALKYTDLTKDTLRKVIAEFAKEIKAKAEKEIKAAKTHSEAYEAWTKWSNSLGSGLFGDLTFKGDKFKSSFELDAYQYRIGGYRYGSYNITDFTVGTAHQAIFITGLTKAAQISSTHKAKARHYISHMNWTGISYVIFVRGDDVDSPWIPRDKFVTWEDVKAAYPKKPKAAGGYSLKSVKGSFDVWTSAGFKSEQVIDDEHENLWFVTVQESKKAGDIPQIIRNLPDKVDNNDMTVVIVPANRLDKFKRDYPQAKEFLAFAAKQVVLDCKTLLSDDEIAAASLSGMDKSWLQVLDVSKIDDPEVSDKKDLMALSTSTAYNKNENLARETGQFYSLKRPDHRQYDWLTARYPLLNNLPRYNFNKNEVYLYMNAKYKQDYAPARKDK